ncbi:MAG: hypothetical protein DRH37_10910 [Deltaproteobacteria bacterium]|nr:MAG: hypothetical protein DRH37_10910 [Deltaproteobacteria bacterium]
MKMEPVAKLYSVCCLMIILALLSCPGCWPGRNRGSVIPETLEIRKVVIVGFMSALSPTDKPGIFTNPLSSSLVSAEPVPPGIVRRMNEILLEKVSTQKNYDLISRKQAIGVYSRIIASDRDIAMAPMKVVRKLGRELNADAVLLGYIYRWQERVGSDYAVKTPASVAFDLLLIRPDDGRILWKSKFEKTQKSLSENILDMSTFLEAGGKWMKAADLAMIGLRKMIREMPSGTGS